VSRAAHSPGSAAAPPGGAWSSEEASGGRPPSPGGSAGKARPGSAGPTRGACGLRAAPVNHGVTAGKPKIAVGAPSKARRCTVAVSKPAFQAPGTKRLKLKCDEPLSNCAFNFNMRRYSKDGNTGFFGADGAGGLSNHRAKVGRCRLAVSKPKLKAGLVSALDTIM